MRLWEIEADYRLQNQAKPKYYVLADNAREAKKKFSARISWLKIYSCAEVYDEGRKKRIVENPRYYIVW
jgi:hypothetical protein